MIQESLLQGWESGFGIVPVMSCFIFTVRPGGRTFFQSGAFFMNKNPHIHFFGGHFAQSGGDTFVDICLVMLMQFRRFLGYLKEFLKNILKIQQFH